VQWEYGKVAGLEHLYLKRFFDRFLNFTQTRQKDKYSSFILVQSDVLEEEGYQLAIRKTIRATRIISTFPGRE